MKPGTVYLVGAGPGDPGLITVKGLMCLKHADVVIYDRLVDEAILSEAPVGAEKIDVGKTASHHTLEQEKINELLLEKAKQGKVVVRLKGGDPFVLGRGGEEAEVLAENGIPFEIVPGVSSAVAVPAYAGIPVTHRRFSSCFTVVTGHKATGKCGPPIAWEKLGAGSDTLVILMGMGNLPSIVDQLVKNGRSTFTPVAVITQGTTQQQRCVTGTLKDIVARVRAEKLDPPSVVVVGDVVQLRDRLEWFVSTTTPPSRTG
jgi:uroporphyrinogen III methyltransferase / synthase